MTRALAWLRGLRPRTILLLGWLVFALYAYPGYMTSDAADQLFDTRIGTFNDWHSPTMTEVWRLVGFAITGPAGMLALQSGLLLGGSYVLLARITRPRPAAVGAAGLLIFPPVMATMAVIWPDGQMAGFLLAGLAAVTSPRRGARIAGVVLLVLAAAMRPTAAIAALPLIAAGIACWRPVTARWRRGLVSLAACAAIWLGALGLDACIRTGSTEHTQLDRALADLAGTVRYAPAFDDARARDLLAGIPIYAGALHARIAAADGHLGQLTYGPSRVFEMPRTAEQRAPIFDAMHRLIRAYPTAYLKHRWRAFFRVLGTRRTKDNLAVYTGFVASDAQGDKVLHAAMHSPVQSAVIFIARMTAHARINRPFLYLILAIVALPFAIRRRHAPAGTLLASGILYELSLFFTATSGAYALSHWLITTTSLAIALMVRNEIRDGRARRRAQGSSSSSAS